MYCRTTNKNARCVDQPEQLSRELVPCGPISVCMPFGRSLVFDGRCLFVEGNNTQLDGVFDQIVVENGCIVEARVAPVPIYTPPPCTPAVTPCDGEGGTGAITLDPSLCNTLSFVSGRLTSNVFITPGAGVDVTGCGSAQSPFVISLEAQDPAETYIVAGDNEIQVTGNGSQANPYAIAHKDGYNGTVLGMVFDDGHLVSYASPDDGGALKVVTAGPGIEVATIGGAATVSMPLQDTGGTYDFGDTRVTISGQGVVTGVVSLTPTPETNFTRFYQANRTSTTLVFTSKYPGTLRVRYRGSLGSGVATDGLSALASPYGLSVNGTAMTAYAENIDSTIVGIEAALADLAADTEYTITLTKSDGAFTNIGIMDAWICQ